MKTSAILLRICAASLAAGAASAVPVHAQEDVTDRSVGVRDVAMSPLEDMNLSQDPIPPILIKARAAPYADDGLQSCAAVLQELGNLDAVLGEDYDTSGIEKRGLSAGRVALGIVNWLIPFRGVIREVSGASKNEFEFREAIVAGLVRRGYLKGMGQAMFCPYPARPATPEVHAAIERSAAEEPPATGQAAE